MVVESYAKAMVMLLESEIAYTDMCCAQYVLKNGQRVDMRRTAVLYAEPPQPRVSFDRFRTSTREGVFAVLVLFAAVISLLLL